MKFLPVKIVIAILAISFGIFLGNSSSSSILLFIGAFDLLLLIFAITMAALLISYFSHARSKKNVHWIWFATFLWLAIFFSFGASFLLTVKSVVDKEHQYELHEGKEDQRKADVIVQAIYLYQKDKGVLPENLSVLIPLYIDAVPTTATGGKYVYEKLLTKPPHFELTYPQGNSSIYYKYYDSESKIWGDHYQNSQSQE